MLRSVQWTKELDIGVESLNEDHRKLIDMLNEIFAACFTGQGTAIVGKTIGKLIEYTHYHFDREIDLLARHGYPGLEAHKAEHRKLIDQVVKLQAEIAAHASDDLSIETMKFLQGWLVDHILSHDKEYAKFLNSKGVSVL